MLFTCLDEWEWVIELNRVGWYGFVEKWVGMSSQERSSSHARYVRGPRF